MRYLLSLFLVMLLAAPVCAEFKGPGAGGGFSGPGAGAGNEGTVASVKNLPDDAMVTLTGQIINKLPYSKDEYTFQDNTGQIQVEISNKLFQGRTVTPENTIRIYGEVDKEFGRPTEIDVKHFEILK